MSEDTVEQDQEQTTIAPSIEMNQERVAKVVISEADKEHFFKCILADKPYEETVYLFDKQLAVRFKSMTVAENADVVQQIIKDKEKNVAADSDSYFITIATYRLAQSLVSVDGKPFSNITKTTFSPLTADDSYILAKAKPITAWSTCKLSVFLDAFQQFEAKVIKLTREVQTPNFWKASM